MGRETHGQRLERIEQVATRLMVEMNAVRLVLRLLFEAEAEAADDAERIPLQAEVAWLIEDLLDQIATDGAEGPRAWLDEAAALAARDLLIGGRGSANTDDSCEAPANENARK